MPIEQHAIHITDAKPASRVRPNRSRIAFGLALVLLGILFLVKQFGLIEITWPLILMVLGGSSLAGSWLSRNTSGLLPGLFLVLLGLIFLADGNDWIRGGVSRNWPLVILALSVSLLILPILKRERQRNWNPGIILFAAGFFMLVVEYGWIKWGGLNDVLIWWPILPIVTGIWFIFRKKSASLPVSDDNSKEDHGN